MAHQQEPIHRRVVVSDSGGAEPVDKASVSHGIGSEPRRELPGIAWHRVVFHQPDSVALEGRSRRSVVYHQSAVGVVPRGLKRPLQGPKTRPHRVRAQHEGSINESPSLAGVVEVEVSLTLRCIPDPMG
ncbi:hypothetical protein ZHAS_00005695 [Anopheles sinensis]|uniref:Uncharacterized protein n=1 Tax=Anopheles sinensis TaxID=74873 RepID=A0A084VK48_ANOSI|nr:hypothetical protein ZHAS_00005695 [Anopheles sinensis]